MSNLVKQYYVQNETEETRVINSNQQIEEKLKKLARMQRRLEAGSENGEFTDGLDAEMVEEVQLPSPEEVLDEAQRNADELIQRANEQATQILAEAQAKAQSLFDEQKRLGYMDGTQRLNEEINQQKMQLQSNFDSRSSELEMEYSKKMETMEADIVDAIIQVFDKVFHIQFEHKLDILIYLIKNTIDHNETDKAFRIRVSIENRKYFSEHPEILMENLPEDILIEYLQDSSFGESDCVIETESGVFDCGLDTEYDSLIRDIRSLC